MELIKGNSAFKWFGIAFILFLAAYHSTLHSLYNFWTRDEYSHGFLLLLVSVYIFYKIIKEKSHLFVLSPSLFWSVSLLICSIGWFASRVTYVEKLELIGLPFILMGLVLSLLGYKNGRFFLLPMVLMLFATPVFDLGNLFLQKATAVLSGIGLSLIGAQVLVEGLLIQVPAGNFIVDSGCSGVRVVTVGASLSLMFAYMNKMAVLGSVGTVIMGMAVSFLGNIIRVMIIVFVGNETNMQHSLVSDHANLGWVVFAVQIFIYFFLLGRVLPWIRKSRYGRLIFLQPSSTSNMISGNKDNKHQRIYMLVVVIFFLAGPAMEFFIGQHVVKSSFSAGLPASINTWKVTYDLQDIWRPGYKAGIPDVAETKIYSNGVSNINLTVYFFAKQSKENEAINIDNRPYDRRVWTPVQVGSFELPKSNIDSLSQVEETLIRHKNIDKIVWRWYEVNNSWTGTAKMAKVHNLIGIFRGKPEMMVYMLVSDVLTSKKATRLNMQNILQGLYHLSLK